MRRKCLKVAKNLEFVISWHTLFTFPPLSLLFQYRERERWKSKRKRERGFSLTFVFRLIPIKKIFLIFLTFFVTFSEKEKKYDDVNEREEWVRSFWNKEKRDRVKERDSFVMREGECTLNEFSFCCAKSRFFLNVKKRFYFIFLSFFSRVKDEEMLKKREREGRKEWLRGEEERSRNESEMNCDITSVTTLIDTFCRHQLLPFFSFSPTFSPIFSLSLFHSSLSIQSVVSSLSMSDPFERKKLVSISIVFGMRRKGKKERGKEKERKKEDFEWNVRRWIDSCGSSSPPSLSLSSLSLSSLRPTVPFILWSFLRGILTRHGLKSSKERRKKREKNRQSLIWNEIEILGIGNLVRNQINFHLNFSWQF